MDDELQQFFSVAVNTEQYPRSEREDLKQQEYDSSQKENGNKKAALRVRKRQQNFWDT